MCYYVIIHKSPWRSSGEKRDGVSSFARRPREVVHSSSRTIITPVMPPELRAPRLCYLSFTIIVVIIIIHYTFLRICRRGWSCVRQRLSVLPKEKKVEKKFVGLNAQIPLLHVHRYVYIIAETIIIDKLPLSISTDLDCCVHWNRNFGSFVHRLLLFFLATAAVFSYHYVAALWFITWRPIIAHHHHHHHPWTTIILYIFSQFRAKRKKPYRCYAGCCMRTLWH